MTHWAAAPVTDIHKRFHPEILAAVGGATLPDGRREFPFRGRREANRFTVERQRNGSIERLASVVAPSLAVATWLLSEELRRALNLPPAPRQQSFHPYVYANLGNLPRTLETAIGWRDIQLTLFGEDKPVPFSAVLFTLEEMHPDRPATLIAETWADRRQTAMWLMSDSLLDYLDK